MAFDQSNPFWDFLEADPEGQRANYFGRLDNPPRRQSPNQRRFFQDQFTAVQDQYMGRLANMVRGGQNPTLGFSDYLSEYFSPGGGGEYDWMQQGSRRSGGSRYTPQVQFDYGTRRPGL